MQRYRFFFRKKEGTREESANITVLRVSNEPKLSLALIFWALQTVVVFLHHLYSVAVRRLRYVVLVPGIVI